MTPTAAVQRQKYLEDAYLYQITTYVIAGGKDPNGAWIALANNIFHPQGGGQPSDKGVVDGTPVQPRRNEEGLVLLYLRPTVETAITDLAVGSLVRAEVDAQSRRKHAALHTSGHLISGLLQSLDLEFVASNHFPGEARVELQASHGIDLESTRRHLESQLSEAISTNLPITTMWRGDRRWVTIQGFAPDPCAGTHLRSLGSLENLRIRSMKRKRDRLKIGYEADHRATPAAAARAWGFRSAQTARSS